MELFEVTYRHQKKNAIKKMFLYKVLHCKINNYKQLIDLLVNSSLIKMLINYLI